MLNHRLLVPGVFGMGALLVVLGLAFIATGVPIVRMEIGWTEVVGGAVAASAGCVILAMGVLAGQLEAIRQNLAYASFEDPLRDDLVAPAPDDTVLADEPSDVTDQQATASFAPTPSARRLAHPLAPQRWAPTEPDVVKAEPTLAVAEPVAPAPPLPSEAEEPAAGPTLDEGAPALVHAEKEMSASPPVAPPDPVADPVADLPATTAPKPRPNFLSSFLARRGIDPTGSALPGERAPFDADLGAPVSPPARTPVDLSSGWEEEDARAEPEHIVAEEPPASEGPEHEVAPEPPTAAAEPPAPPEPDPLQPVVVGRYNAGSASYVMYSNGMIEVETEAGTHQFGSMQELKNFIEKRDARVS